MSKSYSTYEAKARFSEVLRQVREGATVLITYHGRPVAELRPLPDQEISLDDQLARLEREGVVQPARDRTAPLEPVATRPGALDRFLRDRD